MITAEWYLPFIVWPVWKPYSAVFQVSDVTSAGDMVTYHPWQWWPRKLVVLISCTLICPESMVFIYLNVPMYLQIWVWMQSECNVVVQDQYLQQLMQAARMWVLPEHCYHEALEDEFKNPTTYQPRGPRETLCSYCVREYKQLLDVVSRSGLVAALMSQFLIGGMLLLAKFPQWKMCGIKATPVNHESSSTNYQDWWCLENCQVEGCTGEEY